MKPSQASRSVSSRALTSAGRRGCAAALACLYLLAFTPVGLGFSTLLAVSDGGHRIALEETAEGWRLVLHHEQHEIESWAGGHPHGVVAGALTHFQFAGPIEQSDSEDHVIVIELTGVALAAPSGSATKLLSFSLESLGARLFPFLASATAGCLGGTQSSFDLRMRFSPVGTASASQIRTQITSTVLLL